MKPHLFKVLDQWLAFFRGDSAPTGFVAADTPLEAYRKLLAGELSVEYQTPVVEETMQTAEVFHIGASDGPRRPARNRHRVAKSMCRTGVGRAVAQEHYRILPRAGLRK